MTSKPKCHLVGWANKIKQASNGSLELIWNALTLMYTFLDIPFAMVLFRKEFRYCFDLVVEGSPEVAIQCETLFAVKHHMMDHMVDVPQRHRKGETPLRTEATHNIW